MEREDREKVRLGAINITSTLDYSLFREEGKNVFVLDGKRYEIPDNSTLYVLEDKVYVDNRTAFPVEGEGDILEEEKGKDIAAIDRFQSYALEEKKESHRLKIVSLRQAGKEDRLDKRIPIFIYHFDDGKHVFPVQVFRGGKNAKRKGCINYGMIDIYAREGDGDRSIPGFVENLLEKARERVYFLPFYDGDTLYFLGKKKKVTHDRELLGDPDWFYVEKNVHPIKKYKELAFVYLHKRIPEIGAEMGLDLSKWEVKIGDYRTFFACNAYTKHYFCFDYRTAAFRKDILDALVVHEVAHCYHHRHNKAFYSLCERYWPNYHYYDTLLDRGILNEKSLAPEERELYLPKVKV